MKGNVLNPRQTSCKVRVAMLMFLRRGREDKRLWTEEEGKSNIILPEVTCKAIITSATEKFDPLPRQEYRALRHKYYGTEVP